jgi:hypothetical protein
VTNAPVYTNGQWTITLPVAGAAQAFYRLQ